MAKQLGKKLHATSRQNWPRTKSHCVRWTQIPPKLRAPSLLLAQTEVTLVNISRSGDTGLSGLWGICPALPYTRCLKQSSWQKQYCYHYYYYTLIILHRRRDDIPIQIRRRSNFKRFQQIQNSTNVLSALLSNANSWENPCFTTDFVRTESQRAQTSLFFFLKFNLSHKLQLLNVQLNFCSVMCYTVLIWSLILLTLGNNILCI